MPKIVIEIANFQDAVLLAEFAKRLNGVVHLSDEGEEPADLSAFVWLEELSKTNPFTEIENVVEWQTLQRQDRVLVR